MPCRSVDHGIASVSYFAVVVLNVAFKKEMQNPQHNFSKDYDRLDFQRAGVVSWAHVLSWIRIRTEHTC